MTYDIVVGHLDDVGQTLKTMNICLAVEIRIDTRVGAVALGNQIGLVVPFAEQTVHLGFHAHGDVYLGAGDIVTVTFLFVLVVKVERLFCILVIDFHLGTNRRPRHQGENERSE